MRRALAAILVVLASTPAAPGMVGNAPPASAALARHVVLILGSRGTFCTGVAIARDLVLTAAHCALPGADYKLVEFDAAGRGTMRDVAGFARHPAFSLEIFLNHRATADVALVKLAQPLSSAYAPAPLTGPRKPVAVGERLVVAGHGVALRGDGKTGGTVRAATLAVTGQPGTLQIRLYDPATRNTRAGLGACTGDSGAPVFDTSAGAPAVIGVVSWSTGPGNSDGCGGLTGVTPLVRYKDWIVAQARRMGSVLP
ncbi:MAG: trypsin-like serine protease [Proteobacteria bacterium]|nr:trypsin-like serine protease [Pseudomonadota bacterium]